MGNCGSAPAVADDPPSRKSSSRPPSRSTTSSTLPPPRETITPPTASSSKTPPIGQSFDAPPSVPPKDYVAVTAPPGSKTDLTAVARKSKSMEIVHTDRSPETAAKQASSSLVKGDSGDEDEKEVEGGWKVRRRVSRRLSLEVQKRPGQGGGKGASPAWGDPTAADQAAWEAEADADLMSAGGKKGHVAAVGEVADVAGKEKTVSRDGNKEKEVVVSVPPQGSSAYNLTAGRSRLGRQSGNGDEEDGEEGEEGEDGEDQMPGSWRAKRRGRRLSLEADKPPDLALLAALRRSSSAPIQGDLAKRVMQEEREREREIEMATGGSISLLAPIKVSPEGALLSIPTASSRGGGESAVTSPASHSATLIDFAHNFDVDDEEVDDGGGYGVRGGGGGRGGGGDTETPSSSVKTAEVLVKSATPNSFRAKRRKSRRLSLEIEKKPDEAVLAAVRRTHSAPVTAKAAEAAMGAAAWAAVVAGGGAGTDMVSYDGSANQSPLFQPSPAEREREREGVRDPAKKSETDRGERERDTGRGDGGDFQEARKTSSQEARIGAWGGGNVVEFGDDDADDESDTDEGTPHVSSIEDGKDYVRVNPRDTSRRRSMDVYKKALASGESHVAAANMAGLDPNVTNYDDLVDEEADLMSPRKDSGDVESVADFASWKSGNSSGNGQEQGQGQAGQPGFKSKWADYNSADSSSSATNLSVSSDTAGGNRRFPDMSAFGNESQPAPTANPVPGISV